MKVKNLIIVVVLAVVGFIIYKRMFTGATYNKGLPITVSLSDLSNDIGANKEKYDGKRIMFDGYLGYSNTTFSTSGDEKNNKGAFDEAKYPIGVYADVPEEKAEHEEFEILLPKTKGANGFDITPTSTFTNNDVVYTTNDKVKVSYKDAVSISADVKYYCIDNFNTKKEECFSINPVTKKQSYFYHLENVRIDKK